MSDDKPFVQVQEYLINSDQVTALEIKSRDDMGTPNNVIVHTANTRSFQFFNFEAAAVWKILDDRVGFRVPQEHKV